ncbi:MAG: HAD family hydrolase [Arcobacteraceae bacterium]|nr:HAD family hydrolase [Arcobacteraceae bacterium]
MTRVVLFDLDGTLIDSTDAITGTFNYVFEQKEFIDKPNIEKIKALIGYPLEIMFESLGVSPKHSSEFVDLYRQRYRDISCEQTILLKDSIKSLELAASFARLGVVTTKTAKYSYPLLAHLNIDHYFECLVGREDVINPKPDPEPIYKALKKMEIDINRGDIYMIGDTKLDLIASNSANITGLGVLSGYGTKEELLRYSDKIFDNSYEAIKYLYSKR